MSADILKMQLHTSRILFSFCLPTELFWFLFFAGKFNNFHLLVLAGVIPFDIVWGGNLKDKTQLYLMEGVSIAINLLMSLTANLSGIFFILI